MPVICMYWSLSMTQRYVDSIALFPILFSHAHILTYTPPPQIWKTDEKDSHTPNFNSTVVKHVKGEYEKIVIKLMDEDTCTFYFISHTPYARMHARTYAHTYII